MAYALQCSGASFDSNVNRLARQDTGDSDLSEEDLYKAVADITIRKLEKSGK